MRSNAHQVPEGKAAGIGHQGNQTGMLERRIKTVWSPAATPPIHADSVRRLLHTVQISTAVLMAEKFGSKCIEVKMIYDN